MIVINQKIIDFADVVRLLIGERPERFPYERAIQLYQFQLWILFPGRKFVELAGLTAAVKLLEHIEENTFFEQAESQERQASPWLPHLINLADRPPQTLNSICALGKNGAYRAVHDTFVARLGGLPALLYALPPAKLDAEICNRMKRCSVVTDLIDYQLRYMQHIGSDPKASNLNHAKFFVWWPTRKITGRRGVKLASKSVSPKTMNKWCKTWERTAVYLFLNDRCGFSQVPAAVDDSFVDDLLAAADDVNELRRFFGAYAFVMETINPAWLGKTVFGPIPRIPIESKSFAPDELSTIEAYDDNVVLMGNYEDDDD